MEIYDVNSQNSDFDLSRNLGYAIVNENLNEASHFIVQYKITQNHGKIWKPYIKYIIFISSFSCHLHVSILFLSQYSLFSLMFLSIQPSVSKHFINDWCYILLISINIVGIHHNAAWVINYVWISSTDIITSLCFSFPTYAPDRVAVFRNYRTLSQLVIQRKQISNIVSQYHTTCNIQRWTDNCKWIIRQSTVKFIQ